MLKLNTIRLEVSFKRARKLDEISIFKLNRNVNLEEFLKLDRASYEVYPECQVGIPMEIISDPNTPWGMPLNINFESVNTNNQIYVAPTLAIHLVNIELACRAKLLIYDQNFLIKEYLGAEYHAMGMKWLKKKWSKGIFSLQREKTISNESANYETAIDFSTEPGDTNVYHWITRVLPKVKFIKKLPKEIPILFSYIPNTFQTECLKFFQLDNPILVIDPNKIARFKSLILIEGPWAVCNPYQENWLIQETFDRLSHISLENKFSSTQKRKIFIYREKAARRRMINQLEVKKLLEERGYESYSVDDYRYEECASLFNSAEEIVFEHGAAGIWTLFANPNAKIIELLPERNHKSSNEISNYYFWLNCLRKRKFIYLASPNIKLDPWAEYVVDLNLLTLQLDRWLC